MTTPIRLFLVEDHHATRETVAAVLSDHAEIEVVGTAATYAEAVSELPSAKSTMLLCDLGLPDRSGVELIRWVSQNHGTMDIMAYTVHADRDLVLQALETGATGYILKSSSPTDLVDALLNLRDGGAPMSPAIARAVVQSLQRPKASAESILSPRELEVLQALEKGFSYKEVGAQLFVSPHTVHSHIKKIYEKLQAKSRSEMLSAARKEGLL